MSIRARITDALFWVIGTLLLKKAFPKLTENAVTCWADDKIGDFLGWSAPDVCTVLSWVWPAVMVALILWGYHEVYCRLIRKPTSGGDRFSATGVVSEPPQRTWIQRVEPSHVIILGLVIAFGGVIWQWRHAPAVAALRQAPASQPPLPTNPATTAPVTTPPKITTAPADVARKLAAIDELRQILNDDMPPWINKGQQLTTGAWWNWVVGGETAKLRNDTRSFYERGREINEKLERLQKDNVQFPDIHALASSPLGRPYLLKVEKFVTPVLALPDDPLKMGNDLYRFLFEPYAKEAYETLNEVDGWRRTTDQNALQLRRQISQ
jgi:hypothetical protein